jgi:protein TonB
VVGGAHVKPWQGLCLSLLVSLGLHAVILFTARMAGQGDSEAATFELTFESARPAGVERNAGPAPVTQPVAAERGLPTEGPAPAAVPVPPAPSSGADELPQVPAPEPAMVPTGADIAAATAASGVVSGATVTGETDAAGALTAAGPGGPETDATTPPRARVEIFPIYPRSARKAGLEGFVRIAAFINESGIVVSAEVLSSSGHASLDQAALQEVQHAVFEPARNAGKTVPFRLIIPFRFRLN